MRKVVVYYDYEPEIGVNATCLDWEIRNLYFKTFGEFRYFCNIEHGFDYELVEITGENYKELRLQGVFDE